MATNLTPAQLAAYIDHTLLKPDASREQIEKLCAEAREHQFHSVCVNGCWVEAARTFLEGSEVKVAAVVGFPLGANRSSTKAIEAASCVKDGANEVDMVISLPALISGDFDYARADVAEVVRAARAVWQDTIVKVILETAALTEEQTALGCRAAREGGADFVKTSTGFHPKGGATPTTVAWLKKYAGGLKVKAAGGIRDFASALAMIEAGADRLGCSSGVAIVTSQTASAAY